ncbi:hypothetical protein OH76DRAFT_1104788 [Lentinus brumalis]|uniref:Uncharacterized protein n=1 Tax=Lentinus brumalis TaxID=2498619 RepID=A0A371CVE2_9APHY|nr:hypothetical protein OH76DRAFT_1104788 [Polyporus brumalis]
MQHTATTRGQQLVPGQSLPTPTDDPNHAVPIPSPAPPSNVPGGRRLQQRCISPMIRDDTTHNTHLRHGRNPPRVEAQRKPFQHAGRQEAAAVCRPRRRRGRGVATEDGDLVLVQVQDEEEQQRRTGVGERRRRRQRRRGEEGDKSFPDPATFAPAVRLHGSHSS